MNPVKAWIGDVTILDMFSRHQTMKFMSEMMEDELLEAHFTHPKEMEGASRLKQHDNIHKQRCSFEKLLQYAMNRFSKEKLYQMLRAASRDNPSLTKVPHEDSSGHQPPQTAILSMRELREIVESIDANRMKGIQKEEQMHQIKYFETFFEDVEYLKTLKTYFDEKIYMCLYDYCYDPADDIFDANNINVTAPSFRDQTPNGFFLTNSDRSSEIQSYHADDVNRGSVKPGLDLADMNDWEKLSYGVREMYRLNQSWDHLFSQDRLNLDLFDKDSHYELVNFVGYKDFEPVFRLVPDIFVKAYKSVELAKLWWTQANKVYHVLPGKRNASRDFSTRMQALENRMTSLTEEIVQEEEILNIQYKDLESLKKRETRFEMLSNSCEKVEALKNKVGERFNNMLLEREALRQQTGRMLKNSSRLKDLEYKLKRCEENMIATEHELKMLTYQFDILQQDFSLELSIRPDMIRFSAHVEDRIMTIDDSSRKKKKVPTATLP